MARSIISKEEFVSIVDKMVEIEEKIECVEKALMDVEKGCRCDFPQPYLELLVDSINKMLFPDGDFLCDDAPFDEWWFSPWRKGKTNTSYGVKYKGVETELDTPEKFYDFYAGLIDGEN